MASSCVQLSRRATTRIYSDTTQAKTVLASGVFAHPLSSKATPAQLNGAKKGAVTARGPAQAGSSAGQRAHGETLRAAEAREAALRAVRMRRLAERQDEQSEDAKRRLERENYRKRYKWAARKWAASIIAAPILLVTSYYLFKRLVLGHAAKSLPEAPVDHIDEAKAAHDSP